MQMALVVAIDFTASNQPK